MSHRPLPTQAQGGPLLAGVKNILMVASGKGGVGKSTVAANLAVAFTHLGLQTGLLDTDIYGPSVPTMFGVHKPQITTDGHSMQPIIVDGLKLMSMGFLVEPEAAMIWRGPMLNGAIQQFLGEVEWGELDMLVLDLPPGTGDVQLTLSQLLPHGAALIVSTPQDVALADAVRARGMFDRVGTPMVGLVENMSWLACDCGKEHDLFGRGGCRKAAEELHLEFLGELPFEPQVRIAGDAGKPIVAAEPESAAAKTYLALAKTVGESVAHWTGVIQGRMERTADALAKGEIGPGTTLAQASERCPEVFERLMALGMPEPEQGAHVDGSVPIAAIADRWGLDLDAALNDLNAHLLPQKPGARLPVIS